MHEHTASRAQQELLSVRPPRALGFSIAVLARTQSPWSRPTPNPAPPCPPPGLSNTPQPPLSLSLPSVKNKLINLPGATKTLSSWPLDLRRRSSRWRLKEFRVCFEMRFDSGRGSGAKRQRWSCERLSPSAPAWVREQQEGGGGRGKHGASLGAAWGCGTPGTSPPPCLRDPLPFVLGFHYGDPAKTEEFPALGIPVRHQLVTLPLVQMESDAWAPQRPAGLRITRGRGEEHLC